MPIRLICSTDGPLCLRSATTSFWHNRCRRGPSTPTPKAEVRLRVLDDGSWPFADVCPYDISVVNLEEMAETDFKSVDEYIASEPKAVQGVLERVRNIIRK